MPYSMIMCMLLLLITSSGYSQNDKETGVTNVTKATFLDPGFSYEGKVGVNQTVIASAFLSIGFAFGISSTIGNTTVFSIDPAWSLQYRYYYNVVRRSEKGKRTAMNSLNYVAPVYEMYYSKNSINSDYYAEEDRRLLHKFGAVWGMQRNYASRFSLDLNLGLGYLFGKSSYTDSNGQPQSVNTGEFSTIGHITLGFWLNKKRED